MRCLFVAAALLLGTGCAGGRDAPLARGTTPEPAGGCWLHLYGESAYRPPLTTHTGPSRGAISLEGARSLILGPQARLVGDGAAQVPILPPGARIADLAATGLHTSADSFSLVCVSGEETLALERDGTP